MRTLFIYTTPHHSHEALASELGISNSIKTPSGGLFSLPFFGKILAAKSIQRAIAREAPDVILTESLTRDLLAGHYYKKKHRGVKLMAIAADPKIHYVKTGYDIDQMVTNGSLKSVDWFFCSGKQMQDVLPEDKKSNSCVFYPKINYKPTDFKPLFPKNKNVFYFVGSLVKSKGIDRMNNYFINSEDRLIVYGDGPDKYKLHKQIDYRGFNKNPHESASDEACFIVSFADFEPFGIAPIEGMMYGMVPLVSKNCGCKEIVSLIDPDLVFNDTGELRKAHHKVRVDKETYEKYSKKAKQVAEYYLKLSENSYKSCANRARLFVYHKFIFK